MATIKRMKISQKQKDQMVAMMNSQSFDRFIIVKGVFFFHNDKLDSKDGVNHKMIALYKRLRAKRIVYRFVCCYPGHTGLPMNESLVQDENSCLGPIFTRFKKDFWMEIVSVPEILN